MSTADFLHFYVKGGRGFYFFILLFGFGLGILKFKKLPKAAKGIWVVLSLSLILELIGQFIFYKIGTTHPRGHFLFPLQFIAYGYTYSKYASNQKLSRSFMYVAVVLCLASIINGIWFQDIVADRTRFIMVFNVALVLASLVTYMDMLKKPSQVPLHRQGIFWFNTATLLFFASTFFRYAMSEYFLEQYYNTGQYMPKWSINFSKGMNYYLYISYAVAIWLDSKHEVKDEYSTA